MSQLNLVKIQLDLEDIVDAVEELLKIKDQRVLNHMQHMIGEVKKVHIDIVESLKSLYDAARSEDEAQFSASFPIAFNNFDEREALKDPIKIDASCEEIKQDLKSASEIASPYFNRFQQDKIKKIQIIEEKKYIWILRDDKLRDTIRDFYKECKEGLDEVNRLLATNVTKSQDQLVNFLSESEVRFKRIKENYDKLNTLAKY